MEAPKPLSPIENDDINFLDFSLVFNDTSLKCSFYEIDNDSIKINVLSKENKYETKLSFLDFKKLNRYFKMSDTIKELENDLIGLHKSNKIEIKEIFEKELNLCINVLTLDNNKVIISLKKVDLNDKDKINLLIKENEEIKRDLKIKDSKINELVMKSKS